MKKVLQSRQMGIQRGVVLVVALLLLMVLSIAATVSIRGTGSAESVVNNSRRESLALEAAEAALRTCESQARSGTKTIANAVAGVQPTWQQSLTTTWDATSAADRTTAGITTLTIASANDTGTRTFFARSPECMAQYLTVGSTANAVITVRAFGPEVANGIGKPAGTEVWLQSRITLP